MPLSGILTPCNSLDANLPFQLLGLSIATLSTVTRYGLHFSIISNIAPESSSYRDIHHAGMAHLWRTQWLGREDALRLKPSNPLLTATRHHHP